jgi:sulfite reductase alpha subunit-like flavoprotein
MFVLTPATIALCVCVPLLAYFIGKWLFTKDTEIENRRRAAAKLAAKLQAVGLRKTPEFLIDYSVGDYSGMARKIQTLAELFLGGEEPVLAEVETVFRNVLEAKLKSEEGRAYIAAKLAEVTKAVENAAKLAQAV